MKERLRRVTGGCALLVSGGRALHRCVPHAALSMRGPGRSHEQVAIALGELGSGRSACSFRSSILVFPKHVIVADRYVNFTRNLFFFFYIYE